MRTLLPSPTVVAVVTTLIAIHSVVTVPIWAPENVLKPERFVVYPGIGRYTYHAESKTWPEAHKTCVEAKGHLAIPDSPEEADVLLQMMAEAGGTDSNYAHIGFHDQFIEGYFTTVKGTPLKKMGYQYWLSGNPAGGIVQNCGNLALIDGYEPGLNDRECLENPRPFICEFPLWDDYELIEGHGYYKLHTGHRVWTEAWRTCELEGGYLLVLNSVAERDALHYKYASLADASLWYGAHHRYADQVFVTVFDEPLEDTGFSSWASGQPGNASNLLYPYLGISMDERGSELSLVNTDAQLQFICKHGLHYLE